MSTPNPGTRNCTRLYLHQCTLPKLRAKNYYQLKTIRKTAKTLGVIFYGPYCTRDGHPDATNCVTFEGVQWAKVDIFPCNPKFVHGVPSVVAMVEEAVGKENVRRWNQFKIKCTVATVEEPARVASHDNAKEEESRAAAELDAFIADLGIEDMAASDNEHYCDAQEAEVAEAETVADERQKAIVEMADEIEDLKRKLAAAEKKVRLLEIDNAVLRVGKDTVVL